MKCKATVNSIMKAYPCYNRTQVESLFRKLGVEVITPKMAGDLKLGSMICMVKGPEGCECEVCTKKRVTPQDRIWALLYAFGLKKQTILKFVSSELLKTDMDIGTSYSFRSEVGGYVRFGYTRACGILICHTHRSITRQKECIKQLVKLCEAQK